MDRETRINDLVANILSGEGSLIYELWRELDDLCAWYCRKLIHQLPEAFKLEFEDLYNCGFIALCDALQHCSLEKVGNFSQFYLFYLTSAIYRENRLSNGGHYKDGRRRFDPIITGGTISLDAPTDENQEKPEALYNLLSNEQIQNPATDSMNQVIERIYCRQLHSVLEKLITMLPAQQRLVIRQKYYNDQDCARIAEMLGIKRGQVYDLEDRALLQLRSDGLKVGLQKFLNDEENYYSGSGVSQFRQSGTSSTERIAMKHMDLESRFAKLSATKPESCRNDKFTVESNKLHQLSL